MIEMHSKYDNMHQNGMFYALICINNHIIACINCVLSMHSKYDNMHRNEIFYALICINNHVITC